MKKLSFVIPIYNEEKTLKEIVEKVLNLELPKKLEKEVILVNDGSKDSSAEIMTELEKKYSEVRIFHNEKNSGKSQTVKNGLNYTTGDLVVIQDADFEYEPTEIIELVNLYFESNLDVVYGNRFGKKNEIIYLKNYIGNRFLSFLSNLFTYPRIRVWIPDMEVCYKLVTGEIFREVGATIESKSTFGLEPEITAKLSRYKKQDRSRLKFGIVPISYKARTIEEGKKMHALKDGFKALVEIIKFNLL